MERMILSLKNVYMLLMTDDFPIYSESVINKADRKGQTLLRFWQRQIAEDFRSLPCGRMIWRSDEKRNRYTSYICNRNAELKCYREYAKELSSQINTASLLSQLARFVEFLSERRYRQDILIRRVQELVRLVEQEDPCVCAEIAQQLKAAAVPALQEEGRRGELFQAGYLLTLLTLYAAAGEAMDDASMAVLRGNAYSLEALWQAYGREQGRSRSMEFLTVHCSLLQDNPLPRERFFGREMEMYDLREIATAQRKCILSGIGGIGKTELLRQLLRWCGEERVADRIAVVPYIGNLIESFGRAFPGFCRREPEEEFHSILYRMEQGVKQGSRILLLIDNVDKGVEEDPALARLQFLPCGIVITARQQKMEGFEVYQVRPPAVSAGTLIFRDNYGGSLTEEDRKALADLLADEAMCNPAILRLMARAAYSRGWSVEELKKRLKTDGSSIFWQEGDRLVRLRQMYHQLYSYMEIPKECQALVELFTLLPRDHYSTAFLREVFPDVAKKITRKASIRADRKNSSEKQPVNRTTSLDQNVAGDFPEHGLAVLAAGGWLEYDGSGYSMHPLIAQCLRRRVLTEKRLTPVLRFIGRRLLQEDVIGKAEDWDEEIRRICHIFVYMCRFLSGPVSRELIQAALTSVYILFPARQEAKEYCTLLEQLIKRYPGKDDRTEIFRCMVLGHLMLGDKERFVAVYHGQKEQLTVPLPLFLGFCVQTGGALLCQGEFALAEPLLLETLNEAASPSQKATAYYYLILLYEHQGRWEEKQQWVQAGVEYATAHPECGEQILFCILSMQCGVHIQYGRKEAAGASLKKLQSLFQEDLPVSMKAAYENLVGAYELNFGDLEQALAHYSEYLSLGLQYYGGSHPSYISGLGQVAVVLQRLGRFEEAVAAYREVLDYAQEVGDTFRLQVSSNNLAVLYIEMGKPEEALLYLPMALEEGRKLGGIPLAEALRNNARVYGLLGDAKQEYRYYQEALPLLEQAYGSEHPRVTEAKERLEALKGRRGTEKAADVDDIGHK